MRTGPCPKMIFPVLTEFDSMFKNLFLYELRIKLLNAEIDFHMYLCLDIFVTCPKGVQISPWRGRAGQSSDLATFWSQTKIFITRDELPNNFQYLEFSKLIIQ